MLVPLRMPLQQVYGDCRRPETGLSRTYVPILAMLKRWAKAQPYEAQSWDIGRAPSREARS